MPMSATSLELSAIDPISARDICYRQADAVRPHSVKDALFVWQVHRVAL
jgi:hypothetical protein